MRYLYRCRLCKDPSFEIRHDGDFPAQARCLASIHEHQTEKHNEAQADFEITVKPRPRKVEAK